MLDFAAIENGSQTFAELAENLTKAQLYQFTDETIDAMQAIIADAVDADVVFIPLDPQKNDTFGKSEEADLAWTLGHIVVHTTASSEEAAALALTLARGLPVEGRSRYETLWTSVHTIAQVRARLEESRRMRKALLDAWPDEPDLNITYVPFPQVGAMNAIGRFILGLYHDSDHVRQLHDVARQAREARA